MNNVKFQWGFLVLLLFPLSLFSQEREATPSSMELFAELSLVQEGKVLWSHQESYPFEVGKPIPLQIKSDKIVAIISITLYPKSEEWWVAIAQAQVSPLDNEKRASQWYRVRRSFLLKREGKLLFYPFRNRSFSKESQSLGELKLLLSLSPLTSE